MNREPNQYLATAPLYETARKYTLMRAAIATLLLLATSLTTNGDTSFKATGIGPLKDIVDMGNADGWTGEMKSNVYWLTNQNNAGAIRYYYTPYDQKTNGVRQVEVDVTFNGTAKGSRAGLLYGHQTNPRFYYLIVAGEAGQLDVYRRDNKGLSLMMGLSGKPAKSGYTRLGIVENGKEISVRINGQEKLKLENNTTGKGAIGIAAVGTGQFGFTNYRESLVPSKKDEPNAGAPAGNVPDSTTTTTAQPSVKGNATVFNEVSVKDSGRGNWPAFKLLVPKDWEFEGELKAAPQYTEIPYIGSYKVKAPDGRFVESVPWLAFGYSDYQRGQFMQPYLGRPYCRKPNSVGEFFAAIVKMNPDSKVSDFKIVSEDVVPEATKIWQKQMAGAYRNAAEFSQQNAFSGVRMFYDIKTVRVVVRYTEAGKQMESTTFTTFSNTVVVYANGTVKSAMWSLNGTYAVGGPVGSDYLNDPELATIVRSKRDNPDWLYAIDQFYKNRRNIIIQEGIARAAAAKGWKNTTSKTSDDVLDISFNGWKKRNAMSDAGQSKQVNLIHERTTYATPSGGQVNLPSYYSHAYTDNNGNYVLHNDANYNINTDPRFNSRDWNQMPEAR